MASFERLGRIEIDEGRLKIIITAENSHGIWAVAQAYEDGEQLIRNIEYHGLAGWQFYMPGQRYRNGYHGCDTFVAEVEPWYKSPSDITNICYEGLSEKDKSRILELYPDFKWMIGKLDITFSNVFHILNLWKNNQQEFETLVNIGALGCALDGRFYRLSNRKEVIRFLSRNPEWRETCFDYVRLHFRHGATMEQCDRFYCNGRQARLNYEQWLYCDTTGTDMWEYRDYLKMLKELKKNLKDKYWKSPKNFHAAHQKVLHELENKRAAEEAARIVEEERLKKERKAKETVKFEKFIKMMAKWTKKVKTTEGIKVWVPKTVDDVITQAKKLNQCLITCDYIGRVTKKECLLVFLCSREGIPLATAELKIRGRKYSLGQFYCDENKGNYQAKPEHHKALKEWAKKFNVRIAA